MKHARKPLQDQNLQDQLHACCILTKIMHSCFNHVGPFCAARICKIVHSPDTAEPYLVEPTPAAYMARAGSSPAKGAGAGAAGGSGGTEPLEQVGLRDERRREMGDMLV